MKTRAALVAQKLMNLYRNSFAIEGGWRAVNEVFISEADELVIEEIKKLPCGKNLSQHINNLLSSKTRIDSIDPELLPYNGMLHPRQTVKINEDDFLILKTALENFQPDQEHLMYIKSLPVVRQFGSRWTAGVRSILSDDSLVSIWRHVVRTDSALRLWSRASEILSVEATENIRAEVQADMPEYETYLPMFGSNGIDALNSLRRMVL